MKRKMDSRQKTGEEKVPGRKLFERRVCSDMSRENLRKDDQRDKTPNTVGVKHIA